MVKRFYSRRTAFSQNHIMVVVQVVVVGRTLEIVQSNFLLRAGPPRASSLEPYADGF